MRFQKYPDTCGRGLRLRLDSDFLKDKSGATKEIYHLLTRILTFVSHFE